MIDKKILVTILLLLVVAIYSSYRIYKDQMWIPHIEEADILFEATEYSKDVLSWTLIKWTE